MLGLVVPLVDRSPVGCDCGESKAFVFCLMTVLLGLAGADVATTCSYQATFEGFAKAGFSRSEAEELLRRSTMRASKAPQHKP